MNPKRPGSSLTFRAAVIGLLLMPIQLESFKMAQNARVRNRGMFAAICIATVAGTIVGFWALLHVIYRLGGATSRFSPPICPLHLGSEAWNRMSVWAAAPTSPVMAHLVAVIVGFIVVVLLNSLRVKLMWFPFHPIGYAVSSS